MRNKLSKEELTTIVINSVIESVPDPEAVNSFIIDEGFFRESTLESIFMTLQIESLGRIWFITMLEQETGFLIKEPVAFFQENALKKISEVVHHISEELNADD